MGGRGPAPRPGERQPAFYPAEPPERQPAFYPAEPDDAAQPAFYPADPDEPQPRFRPADPDEPQPRFRPPSRAGTVTAATPLMSDPATTRTADEPPRPARRTTPPGRRELPQPDDLERAQAPPAAPPGREAGGWYQEPEDPSPGRRAPEPGDRRAGPPPDRASRASDQGERAWWDDAFRPAARHPGAGRSAWTALASRGRPAARARRPGGPNVTGRPRPRGTASRRVS